MASRTGLGERLRRDGFFQTSADLPRIVELDVAALEPNPAQPRRRFDEAALQDLAASIERHGLLQPVVVARAKPGDGKGGFRLVAGERRLRACKAIGRTTVAAIVSDGDPVELAIIENLQREALDPFDEARAIDRLMRAKGYTQAEVGRAIGRKQNTVSSLLSLASLPERIRDEYPTSDAKVGRSWLIELAGLGDPERQLRLWDEAKRGPVTVRALRAARKAPSLPRPRASKALAAARACLKSLDGVDADGLAADAALREALAKLKAAIEDRLG
ncbi:MAG: ParB/RepB/Spo0J family partition protein [Geminicoccaceae bacterium]|nr:ParB/RepB/Spo0J family partition protein [Geminicoccaceae bacterium]